MRVLTGLLLIVAATSLGACSSGSGSDNGETIEALSFDHFGSECFSFVARFCLRSSSDNGQTYQNFFNAIDGFNYQWGTSYDVIVAWRRLENPPADGPSRTYRLVRIESESPVAPGTLFDIAIRARRYVRDGPSAGGFSNRRHATTTS